MKAQKGYVYYDEKQRVWIGRFSPNDSTAGKRKNFKVRAKTKIAATRKLEERIRALESGIVAPPREMLLDDVCLEYAKRKLIEAEYVGEKKIAGRRELSAPRAWLAQIRYFLGARKLASVKLADLEDFKRALAKLPTRSIVEEHNGRLVLLENERGKARSIEAVNRPLELLRAIYTFAVQNNYLDEKSNPFRFARGLIERHAETKLERFPTFGEELSLLNVCRDDRERGHLHDVLVLAADTGLRQKERATLGIKDIDFKANLIRVRQINAKANKAREIPMTARVRTVLERLCVENKRTGLVLGGLGETRKSFAATCRIAGVEGLDLHGFRHRFVTCAFLADVPRAVVLKASGHSSDEWKTYLNVSPEQLLALLDPMPGQTAEEVEAYALERMRELRDALGFTKIASLLSQLAEKL